MTQPNPIESDTAEECFVCRGKGFFGGTTALNSPPTRCEHCGGSGKEPKTELPDLDAVFRELDQATLMYISNPRVGEIKDAWEKFEQTVHSLLNKARAEAYEDCSSKGGDGSEVRAYAKTRAARLESKGADNV